MTTETTTEDTQMTCLTCNIDFEPDPRGVAFEVPAVDDDAEWDEVARKHADDCEWVATRAHRLMA